MKYDCLFKHLNLHVFTSVTISVCVVTGRMLNECYLPVVCIKTGYPSVSLICHYPTTFHFILVVELVRPWCTNQC